MAGRTRPVKARRVRTRPVRTRSVRSRIVILLILPVTALVALWAFAAGQSLQDSLRQTRARTFTEKVLKPTDQMIAALQDERRMSLSFLGDDATIGRAGFDAQRAETDRTRSLFGRSAADDEITGATRPATRQRMARLAGSLGGLEALRRSVDARTLDRPQALGRYTEYIELAAEIYDEVHSLDPALVRDNRILRTLERARENLSREDALVTGALAAGQLSQEEHLQLVQFAGAHRFLYDDGARGLPSADRARYERIVSGPEFTRFKDLENQLMRGGATEKRPAVDIGAWHTSTEAADAQLAELSNTIRSGTTARARAEASGVLLRLGLMGGLGLIAVVVAIAVAIQAGRRLIAESRGMAATVTTFAHDRLPEIRELARQGEPVPEEIAGQGLGGAPAGPFRVTEIAQIDHAFTEARRAVVRAAEGEAAAHKRLNEVFVTLARRNQSLLQRLLRMLEGMQRATEDPDELRRLFELDSLATRMRRHAEGLVILSGRPSGRSWRNPVRLVDVARAAVSEVEDYARVEVVPMGRTALRGPAVADTIHMMAELIENAAAFSPPNTPIRVTGQQVAHGFVLEVEDRGLGIDPATMDDFNRLLTTDPELDLDDSARLGLFVVARLAARHGIRVTLRGSPYGGVIAIALIPQDLVVESETSRPAVIEAAPTAELPPAPAAAELVSGPPVPGPGPGSGEPVRAHGPTDAIGPVAYAGTPLAAPTPPSEHPPTLTTGELPVRRRQASLAPQLRRSAKARQQEQAVPENEPAPRSPEAARDLMATMQQGWRRGREDTAGEPGSSDSGQFGSGPSDSGQSDMGQSDSGQFGSGPSDSGRYASGPSDSGRYAFGPSGSGEHAAGQYLPGPRDSGQHASGPSDSGQYAFGQPEPGQYEPGQYEPGQYEPGRRESGEHEAGRYERGRHEFGTYGPGWYDAGEDEAGPSEGGPGGSGPGGA
ncbi:nitrate- and nitrite sensing domain-containing protein [Actinomadura sp. 9N407]|uniref:nitrate- and nitrite sensing domain-containing protein n=1 Tax=Actinomadura sp. 9N407 TaxID=3375154 RepID=UPI0037A56D87